MEPSHHLQRIGAIAFGILAALFGAAALTTLAVWLLDQSPGGSWQELALAVALGAVAAVFAFAHRLARLAAHAERARTAH